MLPFPRREMPRPGCHVCGWCFHSCELLLAASATVAAAPPPGVPATMAAAVPIVPAAAAAALGCSSKACVVALTWMVPASPAASTRLALRRQFMRGTPGRGINRQAAVSAIFPITSSHTVHAVPARMHRYPSLPYACTPCWTCDALSKANLCQKRRVGIVRVAAVPACVCPGCMTGVRPPMQPCWSMRPF